MSGSYLGVQTKRNFQLRRALRLMYINAECLFDLEVIIGARENNAHNLQEGTLDVRRWMNNFRKQSAPRQYFRRR